MITHSKAVEEVWQWREKIADKIKDMAPIEQVKYFQERGINLAKEFGIKHSAQNIIHA